MTPQRRQDEIPLCPSALCEEHAILLGIIGPDGVVGYIRPSITVDGDFVRKACEAGAPEARFRFAQPCRESGCRHWTSSRCDVIDDALCIAGAMNSGDESAIQLPKCAIRPDCRWFVQVGPQACRICPFIFNCVPTESRRQA